MTVRAMLAFALLLVCAGAARAENLLLALSSQQVTIESNYAGSDVTLFGAVRADAAMRGRPGAYDLVVTVRGPARTLVLRRKERAAGVWINGEGSSFPRLAAYLAVLSDRPMEELADESARRKEAFGLLAIAQAASEAGAPPAAAGELVRLQTEAGLWREDPHGVSFLDATLFRATIGLPANVPFGSFEVEARLFSGGAEIARETIAFGVAKAGFEARLADLAENWRLAYGVVSALLALAFGWTASVAFRRD
jgi:uncharacterized protein (TIGR02186 family)